MVVHELAQDTTYQRITNADLGILEKGDYVRLETSTERKSGDTTEIVTKERLGHIACVLECDRGVLAIAFREAEHGAEGFTGYSPAEMISTRRLANTTLSILSKTQAQEYGLPNHWLFEVAPVLDVARA